MFKDEIEEVRNLYLKKTEELGYKTVMWSFAYFDWDEKKQPSLEESRKMIINNLHCGEIMLLHPN